MDWLSFYLTYKLIGFIKMNLLVISIVFITALNVSCRVNASEISTSKAIRTETI